MSKPSIIYTLIAYEKIILTDFSELHGNFQQNSMKILDKVQKNASASIDYQSYKFNYLDMNDLTIMSFNNKEFPLDVIYCFLKAVLEDFLKIYSIDEIKVNYKSHYSLTSYTERLSGLMKNYNSNPECKDNLTILSKQIIEFKNNVIRADKFLNQREDILQNIIVQSENLKTDSEVYYKSSKKVKKSACCNRTVFIIAGIIILLLIGYFISVIICGWAYDKC